MSPLEIISVIISVIGVTLTIKETCGVGCLIFLAYCLYAWLFYEFKLYGETILQCFFMAMNFTVYHG